MTCKTLKDFASECRDRAGSGSIAGLIEEVSRLTSENLVLARAVADDGRGGQLKIEPSQVAGILMCKSVSVDATEIEAEIGRKIKAEVIINDSNFHVAVRLSFDPDFPQPGQSEESEEPLSVPDEQEEQGIPITPEPGLT